MKFKKEYQTILFDPTKNYSFEKDVKVNVILPPSLYWVQKVQLPVKFVRDALKFLPSLFEDQLQEGEEYNYFTYKEGEEFIAFAYKQNEILALLARQGISKSNIEALYFAQSELSHMEVSIILNQNEVLSVKDGIVLLLPKEWISGAKAFDFSTLKLSKNNIDVTQYGALDRRKFFILSSLLFVFIILFGFEYIATNVQVEDLEQKRVTIFEKYHLKSTTFQNKSLLKKYEKIDKKQTKIREVIAKVSSIKLQKGDFLNSIFVKGNKIIVSFSGKTQNKNYIEEKLQLKGLKFHSSAKKEQLFIEVTL